MLKPAGNRDSVVTALPKLRARRWLVRIPAYGKKILHSPMQFSPDLGPNHHPIQRVPVVPTSGVERVGREVDHSPPTSAKVKNVWSYNSNAPMCFHNVEDNFTFIT
jgi:hypothetical protein